MRHDRSWIVPLLGVLLMTAACGDSDAAAQPMAPGLIGGWSTAGCEFHRQPRSTTVAGISMPVTPPELDAAMARIDRGGRETYSASYAGLEVDQQNVRAIVYRVPSADFDEFIRDNAEDTCVVVRDAAHTLAELTAWHDRIVRDLPTWTERGIRISTLGARHDGAGVEVGTEDIARARVELPLAYGRQAPLVLVEEGPVTPLASPTVPPAPQPGG
jgi:hypothetical protein